MLAIVSIATIAAVPTVEIAPGVHMPQINLGTCCGSDKTGVVPWIKAGGTGIDSAYDYGKDCPGAKQSEVAAGIAASGVDPSTIFITTKVPGYMNLPPQPNALNTVKQNLQELGMSRVDLVLLHAPQPTAGINAKLWSELEDALAQNLTRAIGVSNFKKSQLEKLLENAKVKPAVNQCRMDVASHDDETIAYCQQQGIQYEAYNVAKGCDTSSSVLKGIAAAHSKSVYQVCFRYIIDRNCVLAAGIGSNATTAAEYAKENLDIFDFKLTDAEITKINAGI